jgi:hypothetical protein
VQKLDIPGGLSAKTGYSILSHQQRCAGIHPVSTETLIRQNYLEFQNYEGNLNVQERLTYKVIIENMVNWNMSEASHYHQDYELSSAEAFVLNY